MMAVSSALILVSTAMVVTGVISAQALLQGHLQTTARMLASTQVGALNPNDPRQSEAFQAILLSEPHVGFAAFSDTQGDEVVRYERGIEESLVRFVSLPGYRFIKDYFTLVHPVLNTVSQKPVGTLTLSANSKLVLNGIFIYLVIFSIAILLSLLVAYFLSIRLPAMVAEPIKILSDKMRRIALSNDLSIRLSHPDALMNDVVKAVNQMLARSHKQSQTLVQSSAKLKDDMEQRSKELSHLQRRVNLILNSAGEGIYGLDTSGRLTFVNQTTAIITGFTVKELQNLDESMLLGHCHSEDSPVKASECALCASFQEGRPFIAYDAALHRKDGSSFPAEYVRKPMIENGKTVGAVVVFRDVTVQKQAEAELDKVNKKLMDTSRQAGMAEVATSVLHNVGNVLNSINVSVTLTVNQIENSKSKNLDKVVDLIQKNEANLAEFFTTDPKGQVVPDYLAELAKAVDHERQETIKELSSLTRNVEHVKDIVAMQQNYAHMGDMKEAHEVKDLLQDAIQINAAALNRAKITVTRQFQAVPKVMVDKNKTLQILVNLMRNARYALKEADCKERELKIRSSLNHQNQVVVSIIDNGIGILEENLTRIFYPGFSTRADGHGIGLHCGANAAKEMGGSLTASSPGPGFGATFDLVLPSEDSEASQKESKTEQNDQSHEVYA